MFLVLVHFVLLFFKQESWEDEEDTEKQQSEGKTTAVVSIFLVKNVFELSINLYYNAKT